MERHHDIESLRQAIFPDPGAGKCRTCKRDIHIGSFRDMLSAREFRISGMCQHCQDGAFADLEAIADNLCLDIDDLPPKEDDLIKWAQSKRINEAEQRWIAAALYAYAYKAH